AILEMEKQPADNQKAQQATKQQLTYEEQKKQQSEARKKQREIEKLESNIETLEDQLNDIEKTIPNQMSYKIMNNCKSCLTKQKIFVQKLMKQWRHGQIYKHNKNLFVSLRPQVNIS